MTEIVLTAIGVGIIVMFGTWYIVGAEFDERLRRFCNENIIIDRSRLDSKILHDWDNGLSKLSLKFTYKTLPASSPLRLVKSDITYEDKGGKE